MQRARPYQRLTSYGIFARNLCDIGIKTVLGNQKDTYLPCLLCIVTEYNRMCMQTHTCTALHVF